MLLVVSRPVDDKELGLVEKVTPRVFDLVPVAGLGGRRPACELRQLVAQPVGCKGDR